jgi:hypothetical protein
MATTTMMEKQNATSALPSVKVADAVWVATALLHRENPDTPSFSREDISEKAEALKSEIATGDYQSIWRHIDHHCVANRRPAPNRPRMLLDVSRGQRRLFRDGDQYDMERNGSPTHPQWDGLPAQFAHLKDWYECEWNINAEDPLLALIGSGKDIWADESADIYIKRLREEW